MIVPVMLAGGSGTRLWPLSREGYPKQFLKLTDEWSLLQQTARRAAAVPGATAPILICNEAHRFLAAEQLRQAGIEGTEILLEPEGRNTAPAVAVACLAQDITAAMKLGQIRDDMVSSHDEDQGVAPVLSFAARQATATAGAVLRPSGSSRISVPSIPACLSCSAARKPVWPRCRSVWVPLPQGTAAATTRRLLQQRPFIRQLQKLLG